MGRWGYAWGIDGGMDGYKLGFLFVLFCPVLFIMLHTHPQSPVSCQKLCIHLSNTSGLSIFQLAVQWYFCQYTSFGCRVKQTVSLNLSVRPTWKILTRHSLPFPELNNFT